MRILSSSSMTVDSIATLLQDSNFSCMKKFFLLLIIFSLVTPSTHAAVGPNGLFGDYFTRMIGPCPASTVVTGFTATAGATYGTRNCSTLTSLLGAIFGAVGVPTEGVAVVGFTPTGTLDRREIGPWRRSGTSISYTWTNVGIGVVTPTQKLHVAGNIMASGAIYVQNSSFAGGALNLQNSTKTGDAMGQWVIYNMGANYGNRLSFRGYPANGSPNIEYFALTDSGNIYSRGKIGIGTATPGQDIEILRENADSTLRFHDPGDAWYSLGIDRSDAQKFKINYGANVGDAAHFTLTNAGNVWLGTAAPGARLDIVSSVAAPSPDLRITNGSKWSWFYQLGVGSYNPATVPSQGLIFSNDNNATISNGGFSIAPWSNIAGGIHIMENGNVGIGKQPLSSYKLDVLGAVNAGSLCINGVCKTDWNSTWIPAWYTEQAINIWEDIYWWVLIGNPNADTCNWDTTRSYSCTPSDARACVDVITDNYCDADGNCSSNAYAKTIECNMNTLLIKSNSRVRQSFSNSQILSVLPMSPGTSHISSDIRTQIYICQRLWYAAPISFTVDTRLRWSWYYNSCWNNIFSWFNGVVWSAVGACQGQPALLAVTCSL